MYKKNNGSPPKGHPANLTQLWEALVSTWASIPAERFQHLVESMPDELRLFWGQKGVKLNIRKVLRMFCTLSVYIHLKTGWREPWMLMDWQPRYIRRVCRNIYLYFSNYTGNQFIVTIRHLGGLRCVIHKNSPGRGTVPCESIRPPWTLRPFATFQASNIKI